MDRRDIEKIIGLPWSLDGTDCIGVCSMALTMMGMDGAAESLERRKSGDISDGDWKRVEAPYMKGDIALSGGDGRELHVSVFYAEPAIRVLSSAISIGAFTCQIKTVKNLIRVYRYDPS